MRAEELPEIRNLPLFRSIKSPAIRSYLLSESRLEVLEEYQSLFGAGTEPINLHILLDGYAKLTLSRPHEGQIIEILSPGAMFIMAAVVLSERHFTTATLLTPSRVLFIPAASLRSMMQLDVGLALFLLHELSRSLRDFVLALGDRKSLSARQRVAKHYSGHLGAITGTIIKKKDAASLLDITPQTFAKLIK